MKDKNKPTDLKEISKDYDKFQIIMSGGKKDGAMDLCILAENERTAAGYAYELADKLGFTDVGLSSQKESLKRQEDGDTSYEFDFPDEKNQILVKAPEVGEQPPKVVLVVTPDVVAELMDPIAIAAKARQKEKEIREERKKRVSAITSNA